VQEDLVELSLEVGCRRRLISVLDICVVLIGPSLNRRVMACVCDVGKFRQRSILAAWSMAIRVWKVVGVTDESIAVNASALAGIH
jgi:hypothetical protein